jgi:hypothetical protein
MERLVEQEVKKTVSRQKEKIFPEALARPSLENKLKPMDLASDEVVRVLMQKLRTLTQEERFRLGHLR